MALLRPLTVLLALALAAVLTAAPASAHAALIASDPADGATLDTPPKRVTLTFNEDLAPQFATIAVSGPDGTGYATGEVRVDAATATTDVTPMTVAAAYVIAYRVVSADGHPVTGQLTFELTRDAPASTSSTAPAAPAPTPSTPSPAGAAPNVDGGQGFPGWLAVAATVVVAGVALVLVRRRG